MLPDIINGSFELLGSVFICLSIRKLWKDKEVKGVSWLHAGFFAAWGYWNLFYYPHLDQWFSFWGGVAIVIANTVWLGQLIWYAWVPGGLAPRLKEIKFTDQTLDDWFGGGRLD